MKAKSFKIGKVSMAPEGSGWRLRYRDPATGRDVRRKLEGLTRSEAESICLHIHNEMLAHGGFIPGQRQGAPAIGDALADAIELAGGLKSTVNERARHARLFCEWLAGAYPKVETWDQLRPAMLQKYVNHLQGKGLAYDSVRLGVAPVKLTWRYCAENWPELVKPCARIKLPKAAPAEIECLDRSEVLALLDWLRDHAPDLWPLACLQGLAGLRMMEAAALRRQDVDLKAGTVTVCDTGHHKPKTTASYRTIPVCSEVVEALRAAMDRQKVQPIGGELFTNSKGELWTMNGLGQRWRRALRHAAAKPERIERANTGKPLPVNPHGLDMPRLAEVPPRKLRAAFVTMAARLGCNESLLGRYVGHAARSVLGAHYRAVDLAELRTVSGIMNGVRSAESAGENGNILALPESEAL